jgi:hypothetical protein
MKPKKKVEFTRSFEVRDSLGALHGIDEYTTFNLSVTGGKETWYAASKHYKSRGANVGHQEYKLFQLQGSNEWLAEI